MLIYLPVHVHLPFACKTKDTRETPPSSPLFEQGNIRTGDEAIVWAKSYQQEAGVGAGTSHPRLRRLGEARMLTFYLGATAECG
jgi:hypothetical protein